MNFWPWVFGYLAIVIAIALIVGRKVKTSDDFVIAGRSLPSFIVAGTLLATWMGGGTILGTAEFIYTYGPFAGLIYTLMEPVGIFILILLAMRVRKMEKYTISGILRDRYGELSGVIASLAIILAYLGIVSYQLQGFGMILELSTGLSYKTSMIVGAIIVLTITLVGGLISVAYTDAMSAFLITFGLLLSIPFAFLHVGGIDGMMSALPEAHHTLLGGLSPIMWIGFMIPTLLLVLGDQNMYQRLFAAKDPKSARRGSIYWLIGCLIINIPIIILATASRASGMELAEGEMDRAILQFSAQYLPFVLGGLVLASSAAFLLTTGDSYLLSSATTCVYDLYAKYINPSAGDRTKLFLGRSIIILFCAVAYIMINIFPSALELQIYSYTIYGACITPALLGAILWKRANKWGGLGSMFVGLVGTIVCKLTIEEMYGINSVVVSGPLAVLTLIIVSLLTGHGD